MEDDDLAAPTPQELSLLGQRDAIHPIFRVPVDEDHNMDDTVCALSRSVVLRCRYSNSASCGTCSVSYWTTSTKLDVGVPRTFASEPFEV